VRHHARWLKPFLFALGGQLKFLRIKYGEEPKKPRSHQDNWDYTSEIYAFGQRFGEQFNDATIRTAFTHHSYVEKEEAHRKEMGLLEKDSQLQLEDNSALSQTGYLFSSSYIKSYLRHSLPKVPEEGHRAIHQYLLSGNVLSHVAGNLGMRDLILCALRLRSGWLLPLCHSRGCPAPPRASPRVGTGMALLSSATEMCERADGGETGAVRIRQR
ncbi:large ribosomal subunit protein mL44-like, partial [Diadema antillarum]|uniref:large ribosomal subunit protein mL44-like n=1 Tax=Diadema antillarum TaxID=105358 RepID=UPI003A89FD00